MERVADKGFIKVINNGSLGSRFRPKNDDAAGGANVSRIIKLNYKVC